MVTGSTGQFGRAVIDALSVGVRPTAITALARDPARAADLAARGVNVRRGDYTDYASMVQAFRGIEKLLFVSTNALEGVIEQHSTVIAAAKHAGVQHIVFTSVVSRSTAPRFRLVRDYLQTEKELIDSGITYTIMRNGYYMDMLPMFIGDAVQTGQIRYPAGEGKTSFTLRSDLAEAAAKVLTSSGHENRVYETCGSTAYTFQDIANALSAVAGRRIDYIDIPVADFEASLRKGGLSPLEVELMVGMADSIKAGEGNCHDPCLEELLGRRPMTLEEFLARAYRPITL
ncbi:MAG: NAD(P)-dependent oxidoreductase [Anaerolineae bacterium]|nr:MAG: NAD(P)-dependent oxidoreductase [Anaerolineae bacterium]